MLATSFLVEDEHHVLAIDVEQSCRWSPTTSVMGLHQPQLLLSGDDPAQTDCGDENTGCDVRYLRCQTHRCQEIDRLHDAISCRWAVLIWCWMVTLVHKVLSWGLDRSAPGETHANEDRPVLMPSLEAGRDSYLPCRRTVVRNTVASFTPHAPVSFHINP